MDPAQLIAQVEHGPQMHGPALLVLVAFALVAAVVALARRAAARKQSGRNPVSGSDRDGVSDQDPEARVPSGRRSG
ncbi:MAG: hypothetical protein ACRDPC_03840 [Solirubrobacteraceae bacterium]